MTPTLNPDVGAEQSFPLPGAVQSIRASRSLAWLGHPLVYTIGTAVTSFLSIGTSLVAPSLLGPAAFGAFALLTSLFQFASKFDLGLSQLADRDLTREGAPAIERGADILRANWAIGGIVLLVIMPLASLAAAISGGLSPFDTALAIAGGGLGMVANAPVTIFRAGAQVWEFTAVALTLQVGMTAPRLAGLVFGGITGCFAVLLLWYGGFAMFFARTGLHASTRPARIWPLVRSALPLFIFNALWFVYLSANRWIAASLSSPDDLGLFAFGANLAFVGLGMISTIAQVYYPKLLGHVARASPGTCSGLVERHALILGPGLALIAVIAHFATHRLITLVFPHFEAATASTIALAVSCISLGVIAWLIPVVIALSSSPKRDSAFMFVPGFFVLVGAMTLGSRLAGIEGQAWGCVAAGLFLFGGLVLRMFWLGVLNRRSAARIYAVQVLLVIALTVIAFLPGPSQKVVAAIHTTRVGDSVPPSGWKLAFEDSFGKGLRLWNDGASGIWEPHYPWGGRTNASNGELQYYIDPRLGVNTGAAGEPSPFSIEGGSLVIRARATRKADQAWQTGLRYTSGLLTTAKSFSFTYGYAEIRARVPRGRGLWSAFWLAPADQTWPPEIDVMEVLGHDTRTNVVTAHTRGFLGFASRSQIRIPTPDLAEAFHIYGVKWTPEEIVWYFDGRAVSNLPTPPDMHGPMYLIVNLAVGGSWPGAPDTTTPFPADLRIDRIRVFLPPSAARTAKL
ncbi:family 16 glycosylhydrolase [Microvirga terricola]|uniref:Family 16 glycosylhydrolase n=1 Tax=Microvirga terricola TaxID=2719797 RepID=A0ABX0VAG8_9HYPH|nr:family 16 glycosylhydrolase [Microvirga terricola]NIX76189.1 family 16 glycosylhydrolase [Microvirga terricola]